MGKKEEVEKAEKELKELEGEVRQAEIELEDAQHRVKSAQARLEWAKKTPTEKARTAGIRDLENAMRDDKKIGTETFQLVISMLKEDPPKSKLALVLEVLLTAIVSLEEEKEE